MPHLWQKTSPIASSSTFTAAFAALPASLDPHGQYSWHKAQVLPLLYNGLITLDKNLQPLPALASSWEVSADGLIYTVHLRRQVKFHHGKELEAADVRYSFQQAAADPTTREEDRTPLTVIAAILTPNRYTVRFVLKEPYAPFLTKLSVACCPIIPHDAMPTFQPVPPGTGPFQLVSFEPGAVITLKKFAAYWENGLPLLDTVILRAVKSVTTRFHMLQSGEVDYVLLDPLYQQHAPSVDTRADLVLVNSAPTGTFSVIFNTRRKPFADVNVRRAFAWAVDKAAVTQHVLGDYGLPVNQPFNPAASPWSVDVADRSPDTGKARELLTHGGYPEGINVNLAVIADAALFIKTAAALRKQLRDAGIHVQIESMSADMVRNRVERGEWDLLLRGEIPPADPDDVYFAAFHSSRVGTSNLSGYHTPTLDALLQAGRRTFHPRKRRQIYRQVVKQLQQEVPELYLFMARWPVAWHRRVQGYDRELLRCCLMHTLTAIASQGFKTIWLTE